MGRLSIVYQAQLHEVLVEVRPGAWSVDRAHLRPVCKINMFIPYRWLRQASQPLSVDRRGSQCLATLTIIRQLEVRIALLNFGALSKAVGKIWPLAVCQTAAEERVFRVDDPAIS